MSWDSSDEEEIDFFTPFNEKRGNLQQYYGKSEKAIGEGGQARVFLGMDPKSRQPVAIKQFNISRDDDGLNPFAVREIMLMQELSQNPHPNILSLVDVFSHNYRLHLVLEYCPCDLRRVISDRRILFSHADIKTIMRMILSGLERIHSNWVLHRDLKPENLLIGTDGNIKISDFGLGKKFGTPNRNFSPQAVTCCYRPPELFFGSSHYGPSVDIWGAGCIFAELLCRKILFPPASDIAMLGAIFNLLGTPTESNWKDCRELPSFIEFQETKPLNLKEIFPAASEDELEFLQTLLQLDPLRRPSATEALKARYFAAPPESTPKEELPYLSLLTPIASSTPSQSSILTPNSVDRSSKRLSEDSHRLSPVPRKKLRFAE